MDYTATWAGLVLAPGAVVLAMLIPVVGRLLDLVPAKYVIAVGGLALALRVVLLDAIWCRSWISII